MNPLEKPKYVPVDGHIVCLEHGSLHEDTTNPYDSLDDTCDRENHRRLSVRLRAGDYPDENGRFAT